MGKENVSSFQIHASYWASLRRLSTEDTKTLHSLSVAVNWPHRPDDMEQLLHLGHGIIASDEIARPIGAGMYFPMGDDFAMVGMMMTLPRLQSGGMGREILNIILTECEDRRLRLNSTAEAWKLYRSAGFQEQGTVVQYQGVVNGSLTSTDCMVLVPQGLQLRSMTVEDLQAILELDRLAFGADRQVLFDLLLARSDGVVLKQDDVLVGYALCRKFGQGHLIGPLVASSQKAAIALAAPFIRAHRGRFLRLDTELSHAQFAEFLIKAGMSRFSTVTPMTMGEGPSLQTSPETVYALASQAMG